MSSVHQLQLKYDAFEDRLLLRVSTTGSEEFRIWLTRRFSRLLLDALNDFLGEQFEAAQAVPTVAKRRPGFEAQKQQQQAVDQAFEQKKAATRSPEYSQPFSESAQDFPLGETGLLATQLQVTRGEKHMRCHFKPLHGKGFNLSVDNKLANQLKMGVLDAALKAGWQLAVVTTAASVAMPGSSRLN